MVDSSFPLDEAAVSPKPPRRPPRSDERTRVKAAGRLTPLHAFLFLSFLTGTAALLHRGWEFYGLGLGERVDHPDFRTLGPGANLGHGYGIAGTLLILTNLLYLLRRRFARLSVGSLRAWLDVHVFTGLFGRVLALFHSSFQARSATSMVTMASLGVVVATGLLGRYMVSLTPRPDEKRLAERLRTLDSVGPGMGQMLAAAVNDVERTRPLERPSLLAALARVPAYVAESRRRSAAIHAVVSRFAAAHPAEVALLDRVLADCRQSYLMEVRAEAASALLKSWRGLHRLAALLMISLVLLHVAVAWYYGFVWVFSH